MLEGSKNTILMDNEKKQIRFCHCEERTKRATKQSLDYDWGFFGEEEIAAVSKPLPRDDIN